MLMLWWKAGTENLIPGGGWCRREVHALGGPFQDDGFGPFFVPRLIYIVLGFPGAFTFFLCFCYRCVRWWLARLFHLSLLLFCLFAPGFFSCLFRYLFDSARSFILDWMEKKHMFVHDQSAFIYGFSCARHYDCNRHHVVQPFACVLNVHFVIVPNAKKYGLQRIWFATIKPDCSFSFGDFVRYILLHNTTCSYLP